MTIIFPRNFQGEKYLILKKRYRPPHLMDAYSNYSTPTMSPEPHSQYNSPSHNTSSRYSSQDSLHSNFSSSSGLRQPPPYRPPPPPLVTTPPHLSPQLILSKSPQYSNGPPNPYTSGLPQVQNFTQPPNSQYQNPLQHPPFVHSNSYAGHPSSKAPAFSNKTSRSHSLDTPASQNEPARRPSSLDLPPSGLDSAPPVPPRRRNSDKALQGGGPEKENIPVGGPMSSSTPTEDKTPVNSNASTPGDTVEVSYQLLFVLSSNF